MPSITAKRLCPDLIFVKHRFEVYREVSSQIREIFAEYTDLVEPLSLDEAFLDVTEVDEEKFKPAYHSFSAPFVANVMNSRKVLQISLAIMTYYDERVITAITTHELAITSSILDRLRMITEGEIKDPDFRRELAEDLTLVINEVLEKFEEFKFAGVEEVYFTGFVVQ